MALRSHVQVAEVLNSPLHESLLLSRYIQSHSIKTKIVSLHIHSQLFIAHILWHRSHPLSCIPCWRLQALISSSKPSQLSAFPKNIFVHSKNRVVISLAAPHSFGWSPKIQNSLSFVRRWRLRALKSCSSKQPQLWRPLRKPGNHLVGKVWSSSHVGLAPIRSISTIYLQGAPCEEDTWQEHQPPGWTPLAGLAAVLGI